MLFELKKSYFIFVTLNQPLVDVGAIFFFLYFLYKMFYLCILNNLQTYACLVKVLYLLKVGNYHFFTEMTRDKQDELIQSVH